MRTYCSGAFNWVSDRSVTDVGWVADMVRDGIEPGKMLCPSNPGQVSQTFIDLLNADASAFDTCLDRTGSEPFAEPDGTVVTNPCRQIIEDAMAPLSKERHKLVFEKIYDKGFNTNYTASWFLVRSGLLLDENGNLKKTNSTCDASTTSLNSTIGPLNQAWADSSGVPSGSVPLLGCGAPAPAILQHEVVVAVAVASADVAQNSLDQHSDEDYIPKASSFLGTARACKRQSQPPKNPSSIQIGLYPCSVT